MEAAEQELKQKLLESGLEPAGFEIPLRNMRAEAALFREANLPLLVENRKLGSQYNKISGAQTVQWEGQMRGDVEFRDVDFGYAGQPSLHGVTFHVPAGSTVAIVGQTGSGKTSLVKLINRIYDVGSGAVLVDGVDVRQW